MCFIFSFFLYVCEDNFSSKNNVLVINSNASYCSKFVSSCYLEVKMENSQYFYNNWEKLKKKYERLV